MSGLKGLNVINYLEYSISDKKNLVISSDDSGKATSRVPLRNEVESCLSNCVQAKVPIQQPANRPS